MARSAAFQPLRNLKGLEKLPEAERALLEQLNAIRLDLARLQARPVFTELKTTSYQAREEEFVRCAPGSSDMTLQLPAPRKENQGARVTVLVESVALGTLTIQCIDGLVNDASSQTVSLVCRIDYVCDGLEGWRSEVGPGLVGLDALPSALALSVLGRSANSAGTRADIQATAASGAVLRESGSVLGFGTVATAGVAANAVTNAKLAQMAARRVKLRADSAGTGDPTDGTGAQLGEILRFATLQSDSTSTGTVVTYTVAEATNVVRFISGITALTLRGATIPGETGQIVVWENNDDTGVNLTFNNEDGSAAAAGNRFRCPGGANLTIAAGNRVLSCYINQRWRIIR